MYCRSFSVNVTDEHWHSKMEPVLHSNNVWQRGQCFSSCLHMTESKKSDCPPGAATMKRKFNDAKQFLVLIPAFFLRPEPFLTKLCVFLPNAGF